MDAIWSRVRQQLKELDQCNIDWEGIKKDGYNIGSTEDYGELWFDAVKSLRTLLKKLPPEECKKELKEETALYFWLNDVIEYADNSLYYYRNLAGLREIDERSSAEACNFISLAFENYVVRVNKDFLKTCQQFGLKDEKDMLQILKMLDRLTNFYVSNCYSNNIIKKDFAGESDLSDEACETFINLVDKNYMEIKMNLIYHRLILSDEDMNSD